ncbi:AMP-binding protein [Palleronia sp. LCG004]|uniref:AMP-binding protein n=1 Tax=Palleronia sp. LCG004 TaxID=3079304 RepID=UPI002942C6DF|nr:AMP-binding protein [Palleronia sp. LCG004]WOI57466.1 AMP-binding protein [Palleronia sp. LCG004]
MGGPEPTFANGSAAAVRFPQADIDDLAQHYCGACFSLSGPGYVRRILPHATCRARRPECRGLLTLGPKGYCHRFSVTGKEMPIGTLASCRRILAKKATAMLEHRSVPMQLVRAIGTHERSLAMAGGDGRSLSYGQLGSFVEHIAPHLRGVQVVGILGAPGIAMAASATGCVIRGTPFVHLDTAMPQAVLRNIVAELGVNLIVTCEAVAPGLLPGHCETLDANALLADLDAAPSEPLRAAKIAPDRPIYLVATSGTTGRPKCIPVTHDAACLSYDWRDAYTPYAPEYRVGIYIFAIWEMFRPLRHGAEIWLPDPGTLMAPRRLADFLIRNKIDEMLFTPSFYETFLSALEPRTAVTLPLRRIVLNGEVVSDNLIRASLRTVPNAELWNLYSICETHDVSISRLTAPAGGRPVSVGVPMEHLRAVILDEADAPCPPNTVGRLHFEGLRMLGPGYVDRPEETRLRFRVLRLEGRKIRLYDTGDEAWLDTDGALYIKGRIAHMLKLRGFSIQTRELTEAMQAYLAFSQAVPWVCTVEGRGPSLVFYHTATSRQISRNQKQWGLGPGTSRMPAALAVELRKVLPSYCVPAYLVQMEAIPLHPVSGKADPRSLPSVIDDTADAESGSASTNDVVFAAAAEALGIAPNRIDPALSFHDLGGDSLMCVTMMLRLEKILGRPVGFDLVMNVPLDRLEQLLGRKPDATSGPERFDRPGILLTGATGFLGGNVLGRASRDLPPEHVVYCLVRDKRRDARDRLDEAARAHGVAPDRYVMVSGQVDTPRFGLDEAAYAALASSVTSVVHCAAVVNMAIGEAEMLEWSARGTEVILSFCRAARADLRFSSSNAVFPNHGGPWPEGPAHSWKGITGYGTAKIAAEQTIVDSGIPSAIVRLPSLYDLNAPNPRDICEILLAAALRAGAWPRGLRFPMIDVTAAAAFLLGPITGCSASFYNLMAGEIAPDTSSGMVAADWLDAVDLPPGVARLVAATPGILHADAAFDTAASRTAWARLSDTPYEAISDTRALLELRAIAYQGEPALT